MGTVGDDDDGFLYGRARYFGRSVKEEGGIELPRARDAKKGGCGRRVGSRAKECKVGEVLFRAK